MKTADFNNFAPGDSTANQTAGDHTNIYESIAASCWQPERVEAPKPDVVGSTADGKSLAERVADATPPMSAEDVAKLSQDIATNLTADGNLARVSGGQFGYSSAIQSAWIEAGQKGVQQVIDKVNEDLKASGSDLRLSMTEPHMVNTVKQEEMQFKFKLTDGNGKEVDSRDHAVVPFAQRRLSKEQIEKEIPLITDIVKTGKLGEESVNDFVKNYFRSAMNNGNLEEVTKKINEALEKAGSPYRIDSKHSHWERSSNKFGQFSNESTDTVTIDLMHKDSKKVLDSASDTTYGFGVINNNIDHYPHEDLLPRKRPVD